MSLRFCCQCDTCNKTLDAFFFGSPGEESSTCTICGPKKRVSRSMAAFHESITKLGGRIVGGYKNANTPVKCVCPRGHRCSPIPNNIRKGQGMCPTCSGNNGAAARREFLENIAHLGGTVLGKYVNCDTPVDCLCRKGHHCSPYPGSIHAGQGMCRTCAGNNPDVARKIFEDNIERHGGQVLGIYKNNHTPVECRCPSGHKYLVNPHDARADSDSCGICYTDYSEINFIADVAKQGGKIVGKLNQTKRFR
jgi:hypothetical protein